MRYDYGSVLNWKIYKSYEPPLIDLKNIKDIPIAIIAGTQDLLVSIDDARWVKE